MVKTLKRTSKKYHRTLLHRRKINNKLRSKKNGVSKRYSKKAVLKQKGGGGGDVTQIKVYIVYEKGKNKEDSEGEFTTDKEFTTLPNTYANKLAFVKQMSKLDMRNIIGLLYQKDEHDWLFCGLNFSYLETDTIPLDERSAGKLSRSEIPPIKRIAKKSSQHIDNTESIKKAITELCGSDIEFPEGFFTQMKNHSSFSCWIRLQKKGVFTFRMKGKGTHQLTSFKYSKEADRVIKDIKYDDPDDPVNSYAEWVYKTIPGKVTTDETNILITPVKKEGIKMVVESSQQDITVNDGDVLFMPYVTTKNYDDYCSDEKREKVNKFGSNECQYNERLFDFNLYEPSIKFPGRPITDKGQYTYSKRGTIDITLGFFNNSFDNVMGSHMLRKLTEFCDFIIESKSVELKTAYVKKMWDVRFRNSIVRTYEYSDIQEIFKPGEFENFLGVETGIPITEEKFIEMKNKV